MAKQLRITSQSLKHYTDQAIRTKHHLAAAISTNPDLKPDRSETTAPAAPPASELETPIYDHTGTLITDPSIFQQTLRTEAKHFYYRDKVVKGKIYKQKETSSVMCETINLFPIDTAAFRLAQASGVDMNRYLQQMAPAILKDFAAKRPQRPIGLTVHSNEGNIHFHIFYSNTTSDHQLIDPPVKGRRKGRTITPSSLAVLRMKAAGVPVDSSRLGLAQMELKRAVESNGGQLPWLFTISKTLDDVMKRLADRDTLKPAWIQAQQVYAEYRAERTANSPRTLKNKLDESGQQILDLKEQNQELCQRLSSANDMITATAAIHVKVKPRPAVKGEDLDW